MLVVTRGGMKDEDIPVKPKKKEKPQLIKDEHGEILITKLDEYIEPEKVVKEAKGDIRDANIYNFGALIKAEEGELLVGNG